MRLHNFIEQLLQRNIHGKTVRQLACLNKGVHLGQEFLYALRGIRHGERDGRV